MNRIYHHHKLWEEVKYNMYGCFDLKDKDILIKKVINYFNNSSLVKYWMEKVIEDFKFSCEHNFTNTSMNRVAWLGQASVAYAYKICDDITKIAWNYLDEETQNRANETAKRLVERWEQCRKNI